MSHAVASNCSLFHSPAQIPEIPRQNVRYSRIFFLRQPDHCPLPSSPPPLDRIRARRGCTRRSSRGRRLEGGAAVPVGEEQPRPPVRVVVDAGCAAVGEEEGSAGSAVAPSVEEPGRRRTTTSVGRSRRCGVPSLPLGRTTVTGRRCRYADCAGARPPPLLVASPPYPPSADPNPFE